MAAAAVKKIAIATVMSHSGFWSSLGDAGGFAVCGALLVDVASAESWPVDSEFITNLH
jgi:hypothetical protein